MIKAVIIDDEKNALEMLEWQLQNYCAQVQVCALCANADDGIAAIRQHHPQLVFLDIEMPRKNGFEVLMAFPEPFFDVIFTTAYDQFAVKAIKFAALDFLLKPVDADDLVAAVQRFEKKQHQKIFGEQLQHLLQQYQQPNALPGKIPFATSEGIIFVKPDSIVYCEAVSNYTHIHLPMAANWWCPKPFAMWRICCSPRVFTGCITPTLSACTRSANMLKPTAALWK